jgi:hypothetical protein
MSRLEDLRPYQRVDGIVSSRSVIVLEVDWIDRNSVEVIYLGAHERPKRAILHRENEAALSISGTSTGPVFMLFDPDLNYEWNEEHGLYSASLSLDEVLIRKVRRCIELDEKLDELRASAGNAASSMDEFREVRDRRWLERMRLREFLQGNRGALVVGADAKVKAFLKRFEQEALAGDVDKGTYYDAFELLGERFDVLGIAERYRRQLLVVTGPSVPHSIHQLLAEAWESWVFGGFSAALILCRAIIEQSLKDLNKAKPWIDVPPEPRLGELLSSSGCPLPRPLVQAGKRVKKAADQLLHSGTSWPGEFSAYAIVRDTCLIVERIFEELPAPTEA